jgi:hypothetical protein
MRQEIQCDVELAGEQVAGARLRAQAVLDQRADHVREVGALSVPLGLRQQLGMRLPQPLGVDHRADDDREPLRLRVVVHAHRDHLADVDAEEFHRRAHRQPAQRLVEAHADVGRRAARRRHRGGLVGEQLEAGPSAAGASSRGPPGSWNATPPASTAAIDCVLSLRPSAPSDTSTPLAFQKRVPSST